MLAVVLIALALLIVAAPPASATYPGRNGDLLVTDMFRTHGFENAARLVRIDPESGAVSRAEVCSQTPATIFPPPLCFWVGPPAASPDGRWVAFAALDVVEEPPYPGPPPPSSIRVLPLDTGERRQVPLPGRTLAFEDIVRWTPSLDFVVVAKDRRVLLAGSDGSDRGTLAEPAVAPDVSSGGRLAFVRSGNQYVLRPSGKPRRLTGKGGHQPSWSPHGNRIAFVRGGWVHTIPVRGGRVRRVTRGFDPVWSPDGKQIAFFRAIPDPGYFGRDTTYLFTLDRHTGRVRRVSPEVIAVPDGIPPSGLDWQPAR
jgi:Tol biopolymer transport system component